MPPDAFRIRATIGEALLTFTGLWLASDNCCLNMASGHIPSDKTEAINNHVDSNVD